MREFQSSIGHSILQKSSPEFFEQRLSELCRLMISPTFSEDSHFLTTFLHAHIKKPLPQNNISFKAEQQYRAGVALWALAKNSPENNTVEQWFKEGSLQATLDVFRQAQSDDNNPYLRDYAAKILRENPQP